MLNVSINVSPQKKSNKNKRSRRSSILQEKIMKIFLAYKISNGVTSHFFIVAKVRFNFLLKKVVGRNQMLKFTKMLDEKILKILMYSYAIL